MHTFKKSILAIALLLMGINGFTQATEAWYIRRTPPEPWTWCPVLNTNITEMDNVFGVGGWNSGYFTTVAVATAFGPTSKFVFLEGGDDHAIPLNNFLIANLATIENWVYNGGCLFLNAAPNYGTDINFGFGGTTLDYPYYSTTAYPTDPTHPIFLGPYMPVGTSWTGNYFCHGRVLGTCLTMLIDESFGAAGVNNIACEKHWGAGTVIFGGMTVTGWHSPFTNARNMRQNILSYLYNYVGVNAGAFDYPDSIYCTGDPDPSPTFDPGADTGVFSATPAGLVIDPATGTIDLSASLPGTYIITNGAIVDCALSSFEMIIGDDPNATFSYPGSPFCSTDPSVVPLFFMGGTPGTFTASPPGLSLNAATGAINIGASTPGTYTVTNSVTSLYCGTDTHSVTVVINPAYAITVNDEICDDVTYILPDGTIAAASGTYVNNFTTAAGCDSIITTNLLIHTTFDVTTNVSLCNGDTYALPDGTITGTAGTYIQNFPTPYGCDSTITTVVAVNPVYTLTENVGICTGDTYTLPSGVVVNATGAYVSNLVTASGCDSTINTNLMVFPTFAVPVAASICSGDSYTLPDGTTTGIAGVYVHTLPSVHACDSVITTTLTVLPTYFPVVNAEICEGFTYTLPDGIIVSTTGTYTTSYTTVSGCDSIITTNLTVHPNPVISFTEDDVICMEQGTITLGASPVGGTYSGTGVAGSLFDPSLAGVGGPYEITYTYTDANGCTSSASVFMSVDQNFADAWGDTTIYAGEPAVLYSTAGGAYDWTPPTQVICPDCAITNAYPLENTTYTMTSVNDNGCIASDYMNVIVLPNPGNSVYIPNSFTPNGDNINDYFFAYGYNLSMIKKMSIYDRWGELVYFGENIPETSEADGWDGTYKGENLNQGVYAYIVELTFTNGVTTTFAGNVTLVK